MELNLKILILAGCGFIFSCGNNQSASHKDHTTEEGKRIYTCPMHPEIIRNVPGNCPICGMVLVEKLNEGKKTTDQSLDFLLKPTNQYVISKVKTTQPVVKSLPKRVIALGRIAYDPRLINTVSARVSGRIEKLFVRYPYQFITKGQKLMDLYSKDLETEQQNFLFLIKSDAENLSLIQAAEQKLILLGLSREQINTLKVNGNVSPTITVYSPYSGHLHGLNQGMESAVSGNDIMGSSASAKSELQVREGTYVSRGQSVINIYGTHRVLALLDVFPEAQGVVKAGQKITLKIDGLDNPIEATIDFVEPAIRENKRTITVRAYIYNPNDSIKIGTNVKAVFEENMQTGLFVPATSIVNLGRKSVVFVKQGELFQTRLVETGGKSGDWTVVIAGIAPNDVIAVNGQMLMDSEGFVKTEVR